MIHYDKNSHIEYYCAYTILTLSLILKQEECRSSAVTVSSLKRMYYSFHSIQNVVSGNCNLNRGI